MAHRGFELYMPCGRGVDEGLGLLPESRLGWRDGTAWARAADGYPANLRAAEAEGECDEYAATVVLAGDVGGDGAGKYLADSGTWTLLHDGSGTVAPALEVTPGGGTGLTMHKVAGDHKYAFARPDGDEGTQAGTFTLSVRITATDPADPVGNVRFVPESALGTYAAQPFAPWLLSALDGLQWARFAAWQREEPGTRGGFGGRDGWAIQATGAGDTPATRAWGARVAPDSPFGQGTHGGVALEHMLALVNAVPGLQPWFSIPHDADAAYARAFAETVRDTLAPDRNVIAEFSNVLGASAVNLADQHFGEGGARLRAAFGAWADVFGGSDELRARLTLAIPAHGDTANLEYVYKTP